MSRDDMGTRKNARAEERSRLWRSARSIARRTAARASAHRIGGTSAEVAFFSLLALPPALLALFATVGTLGRALGPQLTADVETAVLRHASQFLTDDAIVEMVAPTISTILNTSRMDLFSLGVLFALWSTSRAADALLSALRLAYGVRRESWAWRRRGLALIYTIAGTVWGAVLFPLMVAGPRLGRELTRRWGLPNLLGSAWSYSYWPTLIGSALLTLTAAFHFSVPVRTPFRRDLPGAVFSLVLWIFGSSGLRTYAVWAVSESPIYGGLASPILVLMWLYFTALSVILGAELNAAIEAEFPTREAPGEA